MNLICIFYKIWYRKFKKQKMLNKVFSNKVFIVIILLFISFYSDSNIINLTNTKINLIKHRNYFELSKLIINFKVEDTIELNRIGDVLNDEKIIKKIDTFNNTYVVKISINNKHKKYNEIFANNLITFYYYKNNVTHCLMDINKITPYNVEFNEEEVDKLLNNK